ncbi:MAG: hypothetical protein CM1200mP41_03680 [Gammaproteobacteria bacterium]|nr:MAG: hypothetical protein CM1200mP41_03680 [Gammaproteobacteria bacterium]
MKKGCEGPRHAFFDACDQYAESHATLLSLFDLRYQHLQRALFDYSNHELQARKKDRHVQSYEDLLTRLLGALKTSQGNALAEALRADYQAALVDEFQDTDPVQYDILQRIFIDGALPTFLVGDPKQAIYSFRGADIFSYLRARRTLPSDTSLAPIGVPVIDYCKRSMRCLAGALTLTPFVLKTFHSARPRAHPTNDRN